MPRRQEPPSRDVERLRVHADYSRRIGRHSLARALDRGADAIERYDALADWVDDLYDEGHGDDPLLSGALRAEMERRNYGSWAEHSGSRPDNGLRSAETASREAPDER